MIEHGYIRVLEHGEDPAEFLVARPLPAAMDWLQTMFMPLAMRPFLPSSNASQLLGCTIEEFRDHCLYLNTPLYLDPVFGELISISSFRALHHSFYEMRHPVQFDRTGLLVMLARMKGVLGAHRFAHLSGAPLERELQRIKKMKEPARTVRATEFWLAYNDANTVAECLASYRSAVRAKTIQEKTIDRQVDHMARAMAGEEPWRKTRFNGPRTEKQREAARVRMKAMWAKRRGEV